MIVPWERQRRSSKSEQNKLTRRLRGIYLFNATKSSGKFYWYRITFAPEERHIYGLVEAASPPSVEVPWGGCFIDNERGSYSAPTGAKQTSERGQLENQATINER
jgi:hypothetical protein